MSDSRSALKTRVVDISAMLARWLLGATFLVMGWHKVMHPVEFLKLLRQYELVQSPLVLNLISAYLPWIEVFCGLLLVTGIAVRGTSMTVLAMLIPMTLVVIHRALNLKSALGIAFCAVKFDCGCGEGEVFICRKLLQNCGLIIIAIWLLGGAGRRLCVGYALRGVFRRGG